MKKIIFTILVFLGLISIPNTVAAATTNTQGELCNENGILLDVARHPMNKGEIIQVIDHLNPDKFQYVVLHLNDNERVAFQSPLLGNEDDADGLSLNDLKDITATAKQHGIQIVPGFDSPSHCKALLNLLNKSDSKLAHEITLDENTLDYTSNKAIKFMEQINDELNEACGDQDNPYLFMGGDEIPGSMTHNRELMHYFNKLNYYENKHGFHTVMWNDSIRAKNDLDKDITISYWAQGGGITDSEMLQHCTDRADVKQLLDHPLINANPQNNYFQLSDLNDPVYVQSFLNRLKDSNPRNYNLINQDKWVNDANAYQPEVPTTGQLVCLWADTAGQINFDQVLGFVDQLNQVIPKVVVQNKESSSLKNSSSSRSHTEMKASSSSLQSLKAASSRTSLPLQSSEMAVSNSQVQSSENFEKNGVQEVSSQFGKVNSISRSEDVNNQQNIKSNLHSTADSRKVAVDSMNLQKDKMPQNSDPVYSQSKVDSAVINTEKPVNIQASQNVSVNSGQKQTKADQAVISSANKEAVNVGNDGNSSNREQVYQSPVSSTAMRRMHTQTSILQSNIKGYSKNTIRTSDHHLKENILPQTGDQEENWALLGIAFVILAILMASVV